MRRRLVAGNWKMNGTLSALSELRAIAEAHSKPRVGILICPPATLLYEAARMAAGGPVMIGAQDCHQEDAGAHTGDISAAMIADAGGRAVILGHSERREDHNETSALIRAKSEAAQAAGLTTIICVGETEAQRAAANTLDIIAGQLATSVPDECTAANTVVAYEPVWAIGTGNVPSTRQIDEVHDFIRDRLLRRFGQETGDAIPLLYGGSVKSSNAAEIFAADNVDGALVGGASLRAGDFSPIISALEASF